MVSTRAVRSSQPGSTSFKKDSWLSQLVSASERLSRNPSGSRQADPITRLQTQSPWFRHGLFVPHSPTQPAWFEETSRKTKRGGILGQDASPLLRTQSSSSDFFFTGSVTNSRTARGAESPLRMPILVMRVHPPSRP